MKLQSRKQKAESRKGLGFWWVVGVAALVSLAQPLYGRTHHTVAAGSGETITLRVYNYTAASTGTMAQAENEAGYVFGQAGLKIVWLDCLAKNAEPGCSGPDGPAHLALRIQPGEQKLQANQPEDTFGYAVFPSLASVYYSRVKTLAASLDVDQYCAVLLGDVMAHEIGHLLLGPGHHSQTGIMQAKWQTQTLRDEMVRLLHFTSEQASELRSGASERGEALQAKAPANTSE